MRSSQMNGGCCCSGVAIDVFAMRVDLNCSVKSKAIIFEISLRLLLVPIPPHHLWWLYFAHQPSLSSPHEHFCSFTSPPPCHRNLCIIYSHHTTILSTLSSQIDKPAFLFLPQINKPVQLQCPACRKWCHSDPKPCLQPKEAGEFNSVSAWASWANYINLTLLFHCSRSYWSSFGPSLVIWKLRVGVVELNLET